MQKWPISININNITHFSETKSFLQGKKTDGHFSGSGSPPSHLISHPSSFIPNASYIIPHPTYPSLIPHDLTTHSCLIPQLSSITPSSSSLILYPSSFFPNLYTLNHHPPLSYLISSLTPHFLSHPSSLIPPLTALLPLVSNTSSLTSPLLPETSSSTLYLMYSLIQYFILPA